MNRRSFLASSVTASALAGEAGRNLGMAAQTTGQQEREYYELRLYHLHRGRQQNRFEEFLRAVWLPAMNRQGISPIGVFSVMVGPDNPTLYVLIPYKSLESFSSLWSRLSGDEEFKKAGADLLNTPSTDPPFVRMESSLMTAFETFPHLKAPNFGDKQKGRIFELRTYESHSRMANRKKIQMFNSGEIPIFLRAGLLPVFFGDTLIGPKQPQLTYMITFDSMESHDKGWATFGADPEWKKMSTTPGYTDGEIVCNISNSFLRPTPYSQI